MLTTPKFIRPWPSDILPSPSVDQKEPKGQLTIKKNSKELSDKKEKRTYPKIKENKSNKFEIK